MENLVPFERALLFQKWNFLYYKFMQIYNVIVLQLWFFQVCILLGSIIASYTECCSEAYQS